MDHETALLIGIAGLVLLLVLTIFIFLVQSGLFHSVRVSTGRPPIGQFTGAYKFGRGPYKDVGSTFMEATSLNPKLKCFGVYYDDPKKVEAEKLRWAAGTILAEGDAQPDQEDVKLYTENGFKLFTFPSISHAVVTSFPFPSRLSIWLAVLKVYPVMGDYVEEKRLSAHPFLEIYQEGRIDFMAALAKQTEFYIPETGEPKHSQ